MMKETDADRAKRLHVRAELCTGCRLCEAVCAVWHFGVTNPEKARLRVLASEDDDVFKPLVCRQCKKPKCMAACPQGAISRDSATLVMTVDRDGCDGCGKCVEACPFKALVFDSSLGLPLACDLCQGQPQCARFCDSEAIVYAPSRP